MGDLEGNWIVTHLDKEELPPWAGLDLRFEEAEFRVSGSAGCNRYFGRYTIDPAGSGMQFGEMAVTRMMCAPEVMRWENAFLLAFTQVTHYQVGGDELLLQQGRNVLVRARKA